VPRRRPSAFRCLLAGLIPLFALPCVVAAQVTVEFVPYAGVYIPTQKVVDRFSGGLVGCNCQLSLKQKAAVALGGRLTVWWTSHFGAEATLDYSPSGLSIVAGQPADSSGDVFTASARAVMQVSPAGGSPWLRLGGGVGLVSRGSGAYSDRDGSPSVCGTSSFAGVVSAGAGFKLGRGGVALRLDAEDYLYGARLYVNGESPGCGNQYQCRYYGRPQVCNLLEGTSPVNKFQDDLVLSVGLAVPLGVW